MTVRVMREWPKGRSSVGSNGMGSMRGRPMACGAYSARHLAPGLRRSEMTASEVYASMQVGSRSSVPARALDSTTTSPARISLSASSHTAQAAVAGYALTTGTPFSPSVTVQNPQQCLSSPMRILL